MTIKYKITGKQLYEFQIEYGKFFASRVIPKWISKAVSWASIISFGGLCVVFAKNWGHGFMLWWLSCILVVCLNLISQKITAGFYARYYERIPGALDWEHRIEGDRLLTINREVETSFPISPTAVISKSSDFLFVEFNDRGRIRIPLSAFSGDEQIAEFERLFSHV